MLSRYVFRLLLLAAVLFGVAANAQESTLEERVKRLERLVKNQTEFQVEQQRTLKSLQAENRELRGMLEEFGYKAKQLSEQQREIYRDLDDRINHLDPTAPKPTPMVPGSASSSSPGNSVSAGMTVPTAQTNPDKSTDSSSNTKSSLTEKSGLSERETYEQIFPLVREKKYLEALASYQSYLVTFPNGQYGSHAYYWMGQVHYVQGQFDQALQAFNVVIEQFPDSPRVGDALIKKGRILLKKKRWQEAEKLFAHVIKNYGGSTKKLAQEGMKVANKHLQ